VKRAVVLGEGIANRITQKKEGKVSEKAVLKAGQFLTLMFYVSFCCCVFLSHVEYSAQTQGVIQASSREIVHSSDVLDYYKVQRSLSNSFLVLLGRSECSTRISFLFNCLCTLSDHTYFPGGTITMIMEYDKTQADLYKYVCLQKNWGVKIIKLP